MRVSELGSVFRRLAKAVAIVFLLVLSMGLTLPLWLPWVVSGLGPRFGIEVGSYDRQGYSRLQLEDVRVRQTGFSVSVDSVSIPIWPLWVLSGEEGKSASRPELRLQGWQLVVTGSDREPGAEGSVAEILRTVRERMPAIHRFAPEITAREGRVDLNGKIVLLSLVEWRSPRLTILLSPENSAWQAAGALNLSTSDPWLLEARVDPWAITLSAAVMGPVERTRVEFNVDWLKSALSGEAAFGDTGFLPETAWIRSDRLSIETGSFGLEGYEPVSGFLQGSWSGERYAVELEFNASPLSGESELRPPLVASFRADGTLEEHRVNSFTLRSPWASARLSDPLVLTLGPGVMEQEADLEFEVDLGASPWPVDGRLSGLAHVETSTDQWPTVSADLTAEDFAWAEFKGMTGRVGFRFEYPWVHLDEVAVRMPEELEVVFQGRANLGAETVEGTLAAWVESRFLEHFLPPEIAVASISIAGGVEGDWMVPDITLMARAEEVDLPGLQPVVVDVEVTGCGADLDSIAVQISNGVHLLELAGGLRLDEEHDRLQVRRVRLLDGPSLLLTSTMETSIRTDLGKSIVGTLQLQGEDRELRMEMDTLWPESATWSLEARNLKSDLLNGFLEKDTDWFDLDAVQSTGHWDEGSIEFTLDADGSVGIGTERFTYRVAAVGMDDVLQIEHLGIAAAGEDVLRVEGRVPVTLNPAGKQLVVVDWNHPVELEARTSPNPEFWNRMAALFRVDVSDPQLDIKVSGAARNPVGHLKVGASRVAWVSEDDAERMPAISALSLKADLLADRVVLEEGRFSVQGESVSVSGDLPTGRDGWVEQLFQGERPDLQQASLRLRAEDAKVSAFSGFLPTLLAPVGVLDLDLELSPGGDVNGRIDLEGAALRPIRPLGTLREIEARIEFEGREVHCREMAAVIGGQRVSLAGDLSLEQGGEVEFSFRVNGRRVPVVREPGLVVRTDLDLKLEGRSDTDVLLSGSLVLSDSLFVADLDRLLTGNVDAPSQRPPYFSIEAVPFADWRLDVDVAGREFMRVETPVFKGLFSTRMKLTGTLRNPKALGDITVDSGSVDFPFATLKVTSGTLSIQQKNPYDVLLDIQAGARLFGFDVRMLVQDYASAPRLEFESDPNLGSDAVLLMLTTGEIPDRSGYYSMQQRLGKLAVYLGRSLLMEFGIGDGDGENRFVIESGSDISLKGRETYSIEVKLTEDWSLVGGYDEFDAYNGGVKWRVYAK